MALTSDQVMSALRTVQDPELFKDIVSLGMVKDVAIDGDTVNVRVELTTPGCPLKDVIERDVTDAACEKAGRGPCQSRADGPGARSGSPAQGRASAGEKRDRGRRRQRWRGKIDGRIEPGRRPAAAARASVGLMDGDIYGPSMPTMLGIKGIAPQVRGNRLLPHHVHGIYAVTIGSLVEQDKPLIWRGPMAHGAFKQLLLDNTEWPELDYLIVDLPPGTGDVPLTLCQLLPMTGAVVVATPQQVALDDAVRAIHMFEQLKSPILGLIENMSYFVAADGSEHDIFGRGGTEKAAQQLGVPYLGAIPMFTELRVNSDHGKPDWNFTTNPRLRDALESVVRHLAGEVSKRNLQSAGPTLTVS